jgi:hypothetical protein
MHGTTSMQSTLLTAMDDQLQPLRFDQQQPLNGSHWQRLHMSVVHDTSASGKTLAARAVAIAEAH